MKFKEIDLPNIPYSRVREYLSRRHTLYIIAKGYNNSIKFEISWKDTDILDHINDIMLEL